MQKTQSNYSPSPIISYPLIPHLLLRFYALAVKSLTTENIDFIRAVTDYETGIQQEIVKSSGAVSDATREAAKKLYDMYIKQNCEQEVLQTVNRETFCFDSC